LKLQTAAPQRQRKDEIKSVKIPAAKAQQPDKSGLNRATANVTRRFGFFHGNDLQVKLTNSVPAPGQ
jgi:hypothetical protein